MTEQIEVPDGMVLFPYFVKEEDAEMAIKCFASKAALEYDKDLNPIEVDDQTKAKKAVKAILDNKIVKYQEKEVLKAASKDGSIKTDIIH
jgi:hypothetical protein